MVSWCACAHVAAGPSFGHGAPRAVIAWAFDHLAAWARIMAGMAMAGHRYPSAARLRRPVEFKSVLNESRRLRSGVFELDLDPDGEDAVAPAAAESESDAEPEPELATEVAPEPAPASVQDEVDEIPAEAGIDDAAGDAPDTESTR